MSLTEPSVELHKKTTVSHFCSAFVICHHFWQLFLWQSEVRRRSPWSLDSSQRAGVLFFKFRSPAKKGLLSDFYVFVAVPYYV